MRSVAVALAFWLLASLIMLSGCAHQPDCLCSTCETQYYAQWEADHPEGIDQ